MKKESELIDRIYDATIELLQTGEIEKELNLAIIEIRAAELDRKGQPQNGMEQLIYCFIRVCYEGYQMAVRDIANLLRESLKQEKKRKK